MKHTATKEPIITASVDAEVEFYEVDSMQIMWHGNYINFMERARCALLEKINYNYIDMKKDGYVWPVVDIHIKYRRPLTFRQKIRIEATLVEYELGLQLAYKFIDIETGRVTTRAESTQMAININTKETCLVSPKEFTDKVRKYLEQHSNDSHA
ncbi:MAG: acyl-CoA thioesterase [Fibrobacter sp.]|nr:acyl-CoA thioesterase [Fibrobacter sp.]